MKFCDLRCTSHLRKKSYTVFVIRSNEDGCNQDHEKEKVFKITHMIFVSHYMYCTVFWPCDKEPPPSSTQFMHRIWATCWRTENHFMTLHFSGWHVSTFLGRISGTPTALQHYKRAPPFPNKTAGILSFGKEKSERGRVVIKSHFAFWFSRYKMLIFPLWSKILVLHTIKVDVR